MTRILVMKTSITLADAKIHLSALITETEEGAEITITRHWPSGRAHRRRAAGCRPHTR